MDINLFEAWKLWLDGASLVDARIWGVSITWWARLGLIAQYAGALTIIVDIIGPNRLRHFGSRLGTLYSVKDFWNASVNSVKWAFLYWKRVKTEDNELDKELDKRAFTWLTVFGSIGIGIVVGIVAWDYIFWLVAISVGFLAMCLSVWALPVILVTMFVLLNCLGALIDIAIIHPLAWALEQPSIDRLAKIVGLLLLSIGFHFDLLTT